MWERNPARRLVARTQGRLHGRSKAWLWPIAGIALAARLGLFLAAAPWDHSLLNERILVGDAPGYHQIALNLAHRHGFSMATVPPFPPDSLRTPGYPVFLASVYAITGDRPHVALLLQIVVSVATCLITALLASRLWGRRAGIVAGVVVALEPASVMAANHLLSEALFTFLLLGALVRLLISPAQGRGAAGAALGLAILTRPITLYLVPALLPLLAWLAPPGERVRAVARFALACLLVVTPWLVRNAVIFGAPRLSSFQGENLFVYNGGMLRARVEGRAYDVAAAFRDAADLAGDGGADPFVRSQRLSRAALDVIAAHPFAYAYLHAVGSAAALLAPASQQLFKLIGDQRAPVPIVSAADASAATLVARLRSGKSPAQLAYIGVASAALVGVYLLAAFGVAVVARRQPAVACLIAVVVAFFALAPGPQGEARFRVPVIPLVALAAGAACAHGARDAR